MTEAIHIPEGVVVTVEAHNRWIRVERLVEQLLRQAEIDTAALNKWRAATGGLPPELVAKALGWYQTLDLTSIVIRTNLTYDEARAIRAATFEVAT